MLMISRRQILRNSLSISAIVGLTGCVGNGTNDESRESGTENENDGSGTESEPSTPTPDTEWQRNMPACSSGDYTFKVRGVNIDGRSVTVSIENTGVEAYELYRVGIEYRYSSGSEWVQEFTDAVLEGGESASFELDTGIGQVESVLDVNVDVSGESGFEPCW